MKFKGDPLPFDPEALSSDLKESVIRMRDDCQRLSAEALTAGRHEEAAEYRKLEAKAQKMIDEHGLES